MHERAVAPLQPGWAELATPQPPLPQSVLRLLDEPSPASSPSPSPLSSHIEGADDSLPRLVVIGFQKAGTTYLRYLLAAHPQLRTTCTRKQFKNEPSECHFFDRLSRQELVKRSETAHVGVRQLRAAYAESLRDKCGAKVLRKSYVFDVTPSYSRLPLPAIRLVNATVPQRTKFVALLRDPLELKKSRRKMHACVAGTPSNHCTLNETKANDADWTDQYAEHLLAWRSVVGDHRLYTVVFDRLVDEPLDTLNRVLKFAGVPQMSDLPEARQRPRKEEDCAFAPCGYSVDDEIIEHYNDPTVCEMISEQARMDLDKLRATLGVQTPMRWARCRGATGRPMLRYSRSLPSDDDTSADAALAWEKERLSIT